eukprot:TRINITY_DN7836_c0_g1_i1.p1 TRINITY_DN7836_c0_g1~~TRINITY_DN7836_c0_g1_i1.p1  ORF type:complete len:668 (+),score=164.58 TRINITY_DN7836_c0_g1_i1:112-2004(+)
MAFYELKRFREALPDLQRVIDELPGDKETMRLQRLCEAAVRKDVLATSEASTTFTTPVVPLGDDFDTYVPRHIEQASIAGPSTARSAGSRVPALRGLGVVRLQEFAARAVAREVSQNVPQYLDVFRSVPSEYLRQVFQYMDWSSLLQFQKDPHYRPMLSNSALYAILKAEEDRYRTLWAADPHHPALADLTVLLNDVHRNMKLYEYEACDASDDDTVLPKLLVNGTRRTRGSSIVTHEEFINNFNVFSSRQLTGLDWNNVFVAGGSVLAALMPPPSGLDIWEYFHAFAFRASDIDIFIYGLTIEEANRKLVDIFNQIQKHTPSPLVAFRTAHCITLVSAFPYRHIQLILRLYQSPAEILAGFDVDCCSVGFDGLRVWSTSRAARSLKLQYNLVDLSRRSPSYEHRLFKYSRRGFSVAVPGFNRARVKPAILRFYSTKYALSQHRGLARLLILEESYLKYKKGESLYNQEHGPLAKVFDKEERDIHRVQGNPSDYNSIHIPYGPGWNSERAKSIARHMTGQANDHYFRFHLCVPPRAKVTPVIYGPMDKVLEGKVNTGIVNGEVLDTEHHHQTLLVTFKHAGKDDMWRTNNPGGQGTANPTIAGAGGARLMTGSFYPDNSPDDDWYLSAYG